MYLLLTGTLIMSFYVSTVIVKIERIANSNAILLSGHSNGKILFYAFLA